MKTKKLRQDRLYCRSLKKPPLFTFGFILCTWAMVRVFPVLRRRTGKTFTFRVSKRKHKGAIEVTRHKKTCVNLSRFKGPVYIASGVREWIAESFGEDWKKLWVSVKI